VAEASALINKLKKLGINLDLEEDGLYLRLSCCEALGAFTWCCCVCPPLYVPYNKISHIKGADNLWAEKSGMRVGTGVPYVINLGSWWYGGGQDFCAVYNKDPGLVIELEPGYSRYSRWVFSIPNHSELLTQIEQKMGK